MTKLWRIWNKGDWDEFESSVEGDTLMDALRNFEEKEHKRSSVATRKEVFKVELIGDTSD